MDAAEYNSGPSELKRSCEECSSSKVKCSQDKPVCKRCQKQRISCTYAPQKRTGRPRKIPKDSDRSQPRMIRPLASAASKSDSTDPPSMEANSPFSAYSIEQELYSHHQDGLDIYSCSGLHVAGYAAGNTDVAHAETECHFLDHDWSTNAQDLEALWGTTLHQQPYFDSGFGGSGTDLGSHGFMGEDFSTWKGQQKTARIAGSQPSFMYLDLQAGEVDSGQLSVCGQDVSFSPW